MGLGGSERGSDALLTIEEMGAGAEQVVSTRILTIENHKD